MFTELFIKYTFVTQLTFERGCSINCFASPFILLRHRWYQVWGISQHSFFKNKRIACSTVNTYKILHVQCLIKLLALFKKEAPSLMKFSKAIHMLQHLRGLSYFQFCTFTVQIRCNACRDSNYCWEDPCPHLITIYHTISICKRCRGHYKLTIVFNHCTVNNLLTVAAFSNE